MTSINYINNKLKEITSKFDDIKFRYEFRKNTQSHIIEIIPFNLFENNVAYLKEESIFEKEFEKLYPNENIIFISENSLTQISNTI